jgi:hypothetical protein
MAVRFNGRTERAFSLSPDWASLLVALVLATLVRFGILGNVPW